MSKIIDLAQALVNQDSEFFEKKGPGRGDKHTNAFMAELRTNVEKELGPNIAEQHICGDNKLAVDFFLTDEGIVVEVALGLRNPNSEFERDILKCLMASELGHEVRRLHFISKPGAKAKLDQPSSKAILSWLSRNHEIECEVYELQHKGQA